MARPIGRLSLPPRAGHEMKDALEPWSQKVADAVNQEVGKAIASAATVIPAHRVHHITGTTAINTISVHAGFIGEVRFIPDGAFTLGTSGNVAIASTAVVGRLMILQYDPVTSKFYPSY